jgi:cytochrome c peroxidase
LVSRRHIGEWFAGYGSPGMRGGLLLACAATILSAALGFANSAVGAPDAKDGQLPLGTDLGEEAFERPREVFRSEAAGGHKSYMVVLGDVAFSSPKLLGPAARRSGISCGTCHMNGAGNPRLYVPGLSTRPGNFDTTNHFFNPKTDDGVLNPLTIPSLRGSHLLSPYGHDGRTLSLRDFVRNVIVNEFAGDEPPAETLDAMVIYIEDIDFVPNPRMDGSGNLRNPSAVEKRGERLFNRPFAHNPRLSCVSCHQSTEAFVDHRQHDVGSGGLFKTPTLWNANFNAPYFHDGRFADYAQVVDHFDKTYTLRFSARDKQDLVEYLQAIGGGEQAEMPDDLSTRLKEITTFATVLDIALPQHNAAAAALAVDTLNREVRELTEKFPEHKDPSISGGLDERGKARSTLKELVLSLHQIDNAIQEWRFDDASTALAAYRAILPAAVTAMQAAQPWSLFDRKMHDAHYVALRKMYQAGTE